MTATLTRATRVWPAGPARGDGAVAADHLSDDRGRDIVEVWGRDSFPASDPPANW